MMSTLISRYLNDISKIVAKQEDVDTIESSYMPTNITQLCSPAIVWNWKVNPIGQISYEQFQFSDSAPLTSESEVLYISSSNSVSEAFRTFLKVLKANKDFPFQAELDQLIQKNTAPEEYTDGWTKVLINGNLEWKPDWIFSESVYSWKQKVSAGTIHNPGTIKVELHKEDDLSSIFRFDDDPNDSFKFISQFETAEVYADAWGIIFIRPGSWFSNSILKLGESYMPKNVKLFSSRIASFYVADNPKFTFKSKEKVNIAALKKASSIQCFGINAALKYESNGNEVTLHSKTVDPAIVGVVLEHL